MFRNGQWKISELLQEVWLSLFLEELNRERQQQQQQQEEAAEDWYMDIQYGLGDHPR